MKTHSFHLIKTFTRLAIAALIAFTLIATIGCESDGNDRDADNPEQRSWFSFGGKDERREQRIATLEQQLATLESRLASPEESIRRVALWQGIAAAFAVISGIALVGGAALGSRARRMSRPTGAGSANLSPENQPG